MTALLHKFKDAFLSLAYPPLCLHCKESVSHSTDLFCQSCVSLLELIDPTDRCPTCFSPHFAVQFAHCTECSRVHPVMDHVSAAFEYVGPAASMIKALKYGGRVYLAKGAAAYLAAQFLRMEWPFPDLVVPVPIAFNHWMHRGYNQSLLLAQELALLLQCPVKESLTRKSGDFSQAGLSSEQRRRLKGDRIGLKRGADLRGKVILLIDDVMTTGSTMRKCAEVLAEEQPSRIYGLVLCRAT